MKRYLVGLSVVLIIIGCGGTTSTGEREGTGGGGKVAGANPQSGEKEGGTKGKEGAYTQATTRIDDNTVGITGIAQLGLLQDATVKLYEVRVMRTIQEEAYGLSLLHSWKTSKGDINTAGRFNTHSAGLEDNKYYVYEIIGGEDIDYDEDGVMDENVTKNLGAIRALVSGKEMKALADGSFRVTLQSENYFNKIFDEISLFSFPLKAEDIRANATFNPLTDKDTNEDEKVFYSNTQTRYDHKFELVHTRSGYMGEPLWSGKYYTGITSNMFHLSKDEKYAFVVNEYGFLKVDISHIDGMKRDKIYQTNSKSLSVTISKDEKYAFLSNEKGVYILEIGADKITKIATIPSSSARSVTLSKDEKKLYIAEGRAGIKIVDISMISNPVVLSSLGGFHYVDNIVLSKDEKHAYVINGSHGYSSGARVNVLNLEATPTILWNFYTSNPQEIAFSEDATVVYIADGLEGLVIADSSDINEIQPIKTIKENDVLESAFQVKLSQDGSKLFVLAGDRLASNYLHTFSLEDKKNPKLISRMKINGHNFLFDKNERLLFTLDGHYLYGSDMEGII